MCFQEISAMGGGGFHLPADRKRFGGVRASIFALALCGGLLLGSPQSGAQVTEEPAPVALGRTLFMDSSLSSPKGASRISCADCHKPPAEGDTVKTYADSAVLSAVPRRDGDSRTTTRRNTPGLNEINTHSSLLNTTPSSLALAHVETRKAPEGIQYGRDGRYASLEGLVEAKLAGRMMGWLPEEAGEASAHVRSALTSEESYAAQFKAAYDLDLSSLSAEETVAAAARALAEFVSSIRTSATSPFDAYIAINRLQTSPREEFDFSARFYGEETLSIMDHYQARSVLRLPKGFSDEALEGLKIFYNTEDLGAAGNCVMCHTPPAFTDFKFHNGGVSQLQYDAAHGEGSFAKLEIPTGKGAPRPIDRFLDKVSSSAPGRVDLGFWNFADPANEVYRNPKESEADFLGRSIGAFKTPSLRAVGRTAPYMHDGSVATLEDVIRQKIRLSELAREGKLRNADKEYKAILLTEKDIAPLVAFLEALIDIGIGNWREQILRPRRVTPKSVD